MPYKDRDKQLAAQRKHYRDNKPAYDQRSQDTRKQRVERVSEIKESNPCTDCGIFYPYYAMQFDHISNDKVLPVNHLVKSASWDRVMAEIAKCELVCANCHALRTHRRLKGLMI